MDELDAIWRSTHLLPATLTLIWTTKPFATEPNNVKKIIKFNLAGLTFRMSPALGFLTFNPRWIWSVLGVAACSNKPASQHAASDSGYDDVVEKFVLKTNNIPH